MNFHRLHNWIVRFPLCVVICLLVCPPSRGQQQPLTPQYVPPELQATDQEVRKLLDSAKSKADSGKYSLAFADSNSALELAKKKGLTGDKALAEDSVAFDYFISGKPDDALNLYRLSLQDAVDSSNVVLQADVFVSLSALSQLRGDLRGATDLLGTAQDRANESKNPYIRSRVLAELGRVQLASGNPDVGQKLIDEALDIDRVNGYGFEPIHMVYAATAMLLQPQPTIKEAISLLEKARDLAVEKENYIAFVQAQNALGGIYVRSGEVQKGLATLEATRSGKVLKNEGAVELPESFRVAASLPYVRATLLEALAQGYEAAKEPDKAFDTWNELYSFSETVGFKVAAAEAAGKIAGIYKFKNDVPNALAFFSKSIEMWRTLGNDTQLSQVLIGESQVFVQDGKGESAISLEQEILALAEKLHDRKAQFLANLVLAEIYQPANRLEEARKTLETAQSLVTPGPSDSQIDAKVVVETYSRLADLYKDLRLPISELVEIEKAIATLQKAKSDQQNLQQLVGYLKSRLETLKVQDIIEKAMSDDDLSDALWYSEILYIWSGSPSDPGKDENWNRVINLPARVIQKRDGAKSLEEITDSLSPMLGFVDVPILNALANYFLWTEPHPEVAERYAKEAESILRQSPNPADVLLAVPLCQLTVAYSQQHELELTKQKAAQCKETADRSQDVQSMNFAKAAVTTAQIAVNDLPSALSSLQEFLAADPKNPELHSSVASALAGGKLYQQAVVVLPANLDNQGLIF